MSARAIEHPLDAEPAFACAGCGATERVYDCDQCGEVICPDCAVDGVGEDEKVCPNCAAERKPGGAA